MMMQQIVDVVGSPDMVKGRRRDGRDSFKTSLGRSAVVAAVDLGASKVACFIMKPDGRRRRLRPVAWCPGRQHR